MSRMLVLGVPVFFALVAIACLNGDKQAVAGGDCSGISACCGSASASDCGGRRARRQRSGCSGATVSRKGESDCGGCDGRRRMRRRDRCGGRASCCGPVSHMGVSHKGGSAQKGGAVQHGGPVQKGGAVQHGGSVQKGGAVQHGGSVQKGGSMQKSAFVPGRFRTEHLVYRRVIFR